MRLRRLASSQAASGRKSAVSSGTACGSSETSRSSGGDAAGVGDARGVMPSAYACVPSEKSVAAPTKPIASLARAGRATRRHQPL